MIEQLKKHRKILIGAGFLLAFILFKFLSGPRYENPDISSDSDKAQAPNEKQTETLVFGVWSPSQNRAVLAQVESDNEISISSEISGTLSSVNANIGDTVVAGQILAQFKRQNDPTQINYLNAISNLTATKATAQSNVKSSEMALRNAEAELVQTISQQSQSGNQSLANLSTQAKTVETTLQGTLNFLNRQIGATDAYKRESVFGRAYVGSKNAILKNNMKNSIRALVGEFETMHNQPVSTTDFGIRQYAQSRIDFARKLRAEMKNYDILIRDTIISAAFTEANQNTVQSQLDALEPGIDNIITSLTTALESRKGTNESKQMTVLSAENRVRSAKEQLEIAKAQAEAQMVGAQAQVGSAAAAQTDLIVRAPIAGKIVAKEVNRGEQVSIGSPLFTIVNETATKKVVAFLSSQEWVQVKDAEALTIVIDGQEITTEQQFLSAKVDPNSQKIRAEFLLPADAEVLVGSFVKVLIPLQSSQEGLLPLSAIAFEPDGPEVLLVGPDRIAKRQKITVGDIIADSVQILGGLETESEVVQFRNRAFSGERIIKKK